MAAMEGKVLSVSDLSEINRALGVLEGGYTHLREGRRQTAAEKLAAHFDRAAEM